MTHVIVDVPTTPGMFTVKFLRIQMNTAKSLIRVCVCVMSNYFRQTTLAYLSTLVCTNGGLSYTQQ